MAPNVGGNNVFCNTVGGFMSPRGVRGGLGRREAGALPGDMIFSVIGARKKRENGGRGEADREKKRPGGTFWRPAWPSTLIFYDFGLKTGHMKLLHVLGGGARPRTDSATEKWSSGGTWAS